MQGRLNIILMLLTALTLVAACGKSNDGKSGGADKASAPAPKAKPVNGAPIAVEFDTIDRSGKRPMVHVKAYNFGDKKSAGYVFVAKFFDKDGKLLKNKPGTPFEKDHAFTSMSGGMKNVCAPKTWCNLKVWFPDPPEKAKKAELFVTKVDALAADGQKIEEWWQQEEGFSDWPKAASGDKKAEGDKK